MPKSSGLNFDYFDAKEIMLRFDSDLAGLSGESSHQDGAGAATFREGKGIVTDDGARAVNMDGYMAAGEGPRCAEFVDYCEGKTRGIDAVGDQSRVFGVQRKAIEF